MPGSERSARSKPARTVRSGLQETWKRLFTNDRSPPHVKQLPCQLARQRRKARLARNLLFAFVQLYGRRQMAHAHDFELAVVVDDDPDIALAARLALRGQFREIVALSHPKELLPYLDNGRARRHPARPQFRARRDRRRRGVSLAAADPRQGSRRGDRHHHRTRRADHRGRCDQARRGRFRDQALVQRAAGGDGPQRRLAARLEARHPDRAQPRGRNRHPGRRTFPCLGNLPRCGGSIR